MDTSGQLSQSSGSGLIRPVVAHDVPRFFTVTTNKKDEWYQNTAEDCDVDLRELDGGFPLPQNCLYAQDCDLASEEMLQKCHFFFFFSQKTDQGKSPVYNCT